MKIYRIASCTLALVISLACADHSAGKSFPHRALLTSEKEQHAQKVFNNLVRAFQRPKKQPSFSLAPLGQETGGIAMTYLNKGGASIKLDEKAYDMIYASGGAGDDGLAAVLGHELAHYYLDHNWAGDFLHRQDTLITNAFWSLMQGQAISDDHGQGRVLEETQADVEGGMASYLAGYNSLAAMGPTLELLYKAYGIPENARGYPPLSERVAICAQSAKEVKELIKVFETGNRLLLIDKFEEAASCFDFMTRDLNYPTPELFNNAGVARATEAIDLINTINPDSLRFVYPIEFDAQTMLANGTRSAVGERGFGLSGNQLADAQLRASLLLDEAKRDFESAIVRNPQYSVAFLNLACVSEICSDSSLADLQAREALVFSTRGNDPITSANAHIVLGIITATRGNSEYAKTEFETGKTANPQLASFSIARLMDPNATMTSGRNCSEKESSDVEQIGELSAATVWTANSATSSLAIPENPLQGTSFVMSKLIVRESSGKDWHAYEIVNDSTLGRISFLVTPPDYQGTSSNSVKLGSDTSELRHEYGCPTRVRPARQGQYWIYEQSKIIFATDLNGKVRGWTLWRG